MSEAESASDSHDPSRWHNRALNIITSSEDVEQREFAQEVVDSYGRALLMTHDYSARIQDGLYYELDPEEISDGFKIGVSSWHMYIPAMTAGEIVYADVEAHTYDIATVTNTNSLGGARECPRRETITFVDCWLELQVGFSQYGFETDALVTVVQSDLE